MNTVLQHENTAAQIASQGGGALFADWVMARVASDTPPRVCAVLERTPAGEFVAVAVWPPDASDLDRLSPLIQDALQPDQPSLVMQTDDEAECMRAALTCTFDGTVSVIGVCEVTRAQASDLTVEGLDLEALQAATLHSILRRETETTTRALTAMEVLTIGAESGHLETSALAVVNELTARFGLSRVSLGLLKRGLLHKAPSVSLLAASNVSFLKPRSRLRNDLENLMEEALDLERPVYWARAPGAAQMYPTPIAHRSGLTALMAEALYTVPMFGPDGAVGAILCEARAPLSVQDQATLQAIAEILTPMFLAKHKARRWVSGRIVDWLDAGVRRILGPGRPSLKLLVGALVCTLLFLTVVPMQHRLSADAVIEGSTQLVVSAPFDGFVAASTVRPGDEVTKGQSLAQLDDTEFDLDLRKWTGERAQLLQEAQVAQAEGRRADLVLIQAQLEQARAQIALAQLQKERSDLQAPLTGRVVTGDLRHRIGAPVQRGDTLFEISPLGDNRIAIFVPERDIHLVSPGQDGALFLAGAHQSALPLTVTTIGAKSETREGANAFRVEADMGADTSGLRPGLEGVAKIIVGQRPLLDAWTRTTRAWIKRTVWRWSP